MKQNIRIKLIIFLVLGFLLTTFCAFLGISKFKNFVAHAATTEVQTVKESNLKEIKNLVSDGGRKFTRVYNEFGDVETFESSLEPEYVDYLSSEIYSINTNQKRSASRVATNPFEVTTIHDSGLPDEDSIVVVFMGDGYTAGTGANQQGSWPNPVDGSFLSQAKNAAQTLMNTHPFSLFSHLFKIYAIQVISTEEGITGMPDGTGSVKDTYLGTYFERADSIRMPSDKQVNVLELADSVSDNVALVQVLANANAHGGVSYTGAYSDLTTKRVSIVATQSTSNTYWKVAWHGTVLHEFGHSFGQLMDECKLDDTTWLSESYSNITQVSDQATVKWSHWIGYEGITVRSLEDGWYAPAEDRGGCIMRASWANSEFCAVCASELTRRMAAISGETFYGKRLNPGPNTPKVTIPSTEKRILDYAFNGNTSLQNILISSTVQTIGDYAFLGATGLNTIINQRKVPQSINETTFAGVNRSNVNLIVPLKSKNAYINAGWSEFNIVESGWIVTENDNMTICIDGFAEELINDVVIPTEFYGREVTAIGANAFKNQEQITEVILPDTITSIADGAFADCSLLEDISISRYVTNIGEGVFAGCNNLNLNVEELNLNYRSEDNILYDRAMTKIIASGKISPQIEIYDYIKEIAPYSFANNSNLITLSISNISNVSKIGEYAFCNCSNLKTVYYNSYQVPVLGEDSFPNNDFALYVPYIKQSDYILLFGDYTNNVTSQLVQLYFISDGSTDNIKTAYQGDYIGEHLYMPKREGYKFNAWYKNIELSGVPYQANDLIDSSTTLNLYAKWEPEDCKIVLDPNNGELEGEDSLYVKYGSSFNIDVTISREGYTFKGWYDSNNNLCANTTGSSIKNWDKVGETILYAHWAIKSYEIQINNNGLITWLGPTGLSADQCTIPYGTKLAAINLVPAFKESEQGFKIGHIFDHFEYKDNAITWTTIPDLGENGAVITIIPIWKPEHHIIYFNALCEISVNNIEADFGVSISLPTLSRLGYAFKGWFDDAHLGKQIQWTKMPDLTPNDQSNGSKMLYARWEANNYSISYYSNGGEGSMSPSTHTVGISKNLSKNVFTKTGYKFIGWATSSSGNIQYTDEQNVVNLSYSQGGSVQLFAIWEIEVYKITYRYNGAGQVSNPTIYTVETETFYLKAPTGTPKLGYKYVWDKSAIAKGSTGNLTISAVVTPIVYRVIYTNAGGGPGIGYPSIPWYNIKYDQEFTFSQAYEPEEGYVLDCWTLVNEQTGAKTNLGSGDTCTIKNLTTVDGDLFTLTAEYKKKTCVTEGTLITLADGTQKAVEQLTGDEMLLVWNLQTGTFDAAPILFIDSDPADIYEVINLYFSDGTEVKVIYEHAFWDFDLNQYVFLRNDAAKNIGHWFNKQTTDENGQLTWTKVQLTNVVVKDEYTTSWSPVTYSHLCYYVNGMLSMPGATEGLINIFEVDAESMKYDTAAMERDIEQYGLFTYDEFAQILPVPQEVFDAFNAQYFKVAIGKGLITEEKLSALVERYAGQLGIE